jgi:hypothetical protein
MGATFFFHRERFMGLYSVLAFLAFGLASVSCSVFSDKDSVVTTLDAGGGRSVVILADNRPDSVQAFYYRVEADGKVTLPASFFMSIWGSTDPDQLRFKILKGKDGNLIGVVGEEEPARILILHDFDSGGSWPGGCDAGIRTECRQKARALLAELQKEHPTTALALSEDK